MNAQAKERANFRFADVVVDPANCLVVRHGRKQELGPRAFDVLCYLLERHGRLVGKQEIFERIWGEVFVTDGALTQAVKEVRKAIGDDAKTPRFIETVRRRGYRFVAPVEVPERKIRLAVLPFTNLSGDADWEFLADALTEEMILVLGRLDPGLSVIARTSSMQYKRTSKRVDEIGRELKVDYLLEGSIAAQQHRSRVTARLVQVSDEAPLWSDTHEGDWRDFTVLTERIARGVGRALGLGGTQDPRTDDRTDRADVHPEAREAYLKGRYFWYKWTEDGFAKGLEYLQRAIEIGPNFAAAHVGVANAFSAMGYYGVIAPRDAFPRSRAAATRALQLEPDFAAAHVSLAMVHLFYDWDWPGAERELAWALEPDVGDVDALLAQANFLWAMGRFDEALGVLRRAQSLDPLSLILSAAIGATWYLARAYERAAEAIEKTLEMEPTFVPALGTLGRARLGLGDVDGGIAALRSARQMSRDEAGAVAELGYACGVAGQRRDAQRILEELEDRAKERYVCPMGPALVHLGLGNDEGALRLLGKAVEQRASQVVNLNVDPWLDRLRDHPSFLEIQRQVGLPSAPLPHGRSRAT